MSDVQSQADTANQNESVTEATTTEEKPEGAKLSYEDLAAELAKTRREAAERRVKNKEAEKELEDFRKWKESQMTELEKAQAAMKTLADERRSDLVELAITKFGLEAEDADILTGATKEEIFASAKRLSDRIGKREGATEEKPNPNLFPGVRGNPVGADKTKNDPNDELKRALGWIA